MARRPVTLVDVIQSDRDLAPLYSEEDLIFQVTEAVAKAMTTRGVTQADLARLAGVSRQAISRLLQGKNITIRRLARTLHVLGFRLYLVLQDIPSTASGSDFWDHTVELPSLPPPSSWASQTCTAPGDEGMVA